MACIKGSLFMDLIAFSGVVFAAPGLGFVRLVLCYCLFVCC